MKKVYALGMAAILVMASVTTFGQAKNILCSSISPRLPVVLVLPRIHTSRQFMRKTLPTYTMWRIIHHGLAMTQCMNTTQPKAKRWSVFTAFQVYLP